MVSLMQRRREMMKAAGVTPPTPVDALYPVGNFTDYHPSSAYWTVARPHCSCTTSANSRNLYFGKTQHNTAHSTSWAKLFTLNDGDEYELTVKNIEYTSSSSGSNYISIYLYTSAGASAIGTQKISFGSGSGTVADTSFTGTYSGDSVDINAVRFTIYRTVSPLEFDLYFKVNGVWYTI